MKRKIQLQVIRELIRQLDEEENIDAGVQYRNPVSAYTCPELAAREWECFFREHPQVIGLSGDLPEPGSYITLNDFGTPILAVRDKDARFRVFLNACRHRGVRVAGEARGKAFTFMCPFHNWTYSSRGELINIPREQDFGDVDRACNGLIELPAAEAHGLLFVHPQPEGELDVDALLGDLGPELDLWNYGSLMYAGESLLTADLNWKLANDTFGETYHFPRLHRNTLGKVFYGDALHYTEFGRNHRFVWAERGLDEVRRLPESEWDYEKATSQLYYLFPNVQLTAGHQGCSLIKIYPDSRNPGRSISRIGHYFSREVLDRSKEAATFDRNAVYDPDNRSGLGSVEATMEVFKSTIEQEDYLMGETTQRAAESGILEYVQFGRNEPALHHYHNSFREALNLPPLERVGQDSGETLLAPLLPPAGLSCMLNQAPAAK